MWSLMWLTSHFDLLPWAEERLAKSPCLQFESLSIRIWHTYTFFSSSFQLVCWAVIPPTGSKDKVGVIWMVPDKTKQNGALWKQHLSARQRLDFFWTKCPFSLAPLTAVTSLQASATVFCTETTHRLHAGSWTVKRWDGVLAPGTNSSAVGGPIWRFTASPSP